jgi:hypothetical protein
MFLPVCLGFVEAGELEDVEMACLFIYVFDSTY